MKKKFFNWRRFLKKNLPNSETIKRNKYVNWIGPAIHHPRLWQINRHGIALGMSIGVFFGFLIPFLQIPLAALLAVFLRANIVLAVFSTLVTNPLTFPPFYYFAYKIGSVITGQTIENNSESIVDSIVDESNLFTFLIFEKILDVGKPLLIGLPFVAIISSLFVYFFVLFIWRFVIAIEWNKRKKK